LDEELLEIKKKEGVEGGAGADMTSVLEQQQR
jgi:hypothetical protein